MDEHRLLKEFDFRSPENRPALLMMQFVVRSALTCFALVFLLGGLAGWSVSQLYDKPLGAAIAVLVPTAMALWVGRAFYSTNGTMARRSSKHDG